jgi:3-deoxy-D-manno-octulosonic-acid transferase
MRTIYSIAFYLSIPFILVHFAIRGISDRAYLKRWSERLGWYRKAVAPGGIIIHAASVGELTAAIPLLRELKATRPGTSITITTFTPTGSRRALRLTDAQTGHFFAPLDFPGAVHRFLDHCQPDLLIIMETEIWPNLFHEANKRGIPVLMANARMSDKSFIGYRRFSGLTSEALQNTRYICAQSTTDLNRILACGADPGNCSAPGNLKFELDVAPGLAEKAAEMRKQWGQQRPVWIAASTHENDDEVVLSAFETVAQSLSDALLILVPRHPERFSAAAKLFESKGFRTELFSEGPACSERAQCFVINTMGKLMDYYACSDLALIGGTFGNVGGHNPLEASALGLPVLFGPDTSNFADISKEQMVRGAAVKVRDSRALAEQVLSLLANPADHTAMGDAGREMVLQGRGSLQETMQVVEDLLNQESY